MRQRIRQEIERYVNDLQEDSTKRWPHYLLEIDNARIGTIHYLCGEIIRQHAAEAGVDPDFITIDGDEMALLQAESVREIVGEIAQDTIFDPLFETLHVRGVHTLAETMLYRRLDVTEIFNQPSSWLTQWQTYLKSNSQKQLKQLLAQSKWVKNVKKLINIKPLNAADKIAIIRHDVLTLLSIIENKQSSIVASFEAANQVIETIKLTGGKRVAWGDAETLKDVKDSLKNCT